MSRTLGMSSEDVLAIASRLSACTSALDSVRTTVDRVVLASLNPLSYGIQPGGLLIAPWSIAGTAWAAVAVHSALGEIQALSRRLVAEVVAQIEASEALADGSSVPGALIEALTLAILRDPRLLGGMSPESVAAWWARLTPAERDRITALHPLVIGNTEGIPYGDRDAANRRALQQLLADESLPAGQRRALEAVRDALDDADKRHVTAQLMILDFPEGADPRAAIAYGDLDAADSIGIVVPGMDNTVEKDMAKLGTAAYNLYSEQQLLISKSGSGQRHAVVAWMGYQTPGALPNLEVLGEGRAKVGAGYLAGTLGGLQATLGSGPRITVFAHSYGTRVATYALSEGASADSLVMFGSPGVAEGVDSVSDLGVPPGEVYATRAQADGTAGLGLFGSGNLDPMDDRFGVRPFSSEGSPGRDGVDDHGMLLTEESNGKKQGYLDRGTDSAHDMALIGLGRGDEVE